MRWRMAELSLAASVRSYLHALPALERRLVTRALSWLRRNPTRGMKLWGSSDLFLLHLYGTVEIVYRFGAGRIEVVALKGPPLSLCEERIAAVVLAAGEEEVAGLPLPLLPIEGLPLIARVIDLFAASGVDEVIAVLGYKAGEVKKALEDRDVKVVINHDYSKGLSRSLRCGLQIVSPETSAVVICLGNLPFVSPETVRHLLSVYREKRRAIVAPVCGQRRGHPVVFDVSLIPELLKVRGNHGGRTVIKRHRGDLVEVRVEDPGIFTQIEPKAA